MVADALELPLKDVKIAHLSFFNETTFRMKKSSLWKYYNDTENEMIKEIALDKYQTTYLHRITSMKLFEKEVQIMTDVIKQLNAKEIYVGYVYDSLLCHPKDKEIVEKTMNEVIRKHKVKTIASIKD